MTCVVGVIHENNVWLGADSAAFADLDIVTRSDEKVFQNEEFIIGFSGSYRIGQLIRYAFTPPEKSAKSTEMSFMVNEFVDAIRDLCKEKGVLGKENEIEVMEASLLVGYAGKIYCIEQDFQVSILAERYAAIGTGSQVALGALHALKDFKDIPPTERINKALQAASEYSVGVRSPYVVIGQLIKQ